MDQIKILKRALNITINYRVLWIFGILLALTGAGSGGGSNGGGSSGSSNNDGNNDFNWDNLFDGKNPFRQFPELTPEVINILIGVLIGFVCLIIILSVIGTIVRYVSETALIRMVDQHETSGETLTFREGWRLGWSRPAWNMFLMDLLIGLATLIVFLAALIVAALPLLVWFTQSTPLQVLGTLIAVGLILLVVFATVLIGLALSLVLLFARRAIALEDLGPIEAIRRGYSIVRARLTDILLMGLIMFGIAILWGLVMIPVFLAAALVAAVVAVLPALLVGGIAGLFTTGATPWIVGAIIGLPLFIIVILIPSTLVEGWHQVFSSSAWTLTYREALALIKTKENSELPAPEAA